MPNDIILFFENIVLRINGLHLSKEGEILIKIFSTIESGLRNPIGDLQY